jgi:hypothetical protein
VDTSTTELNEYGQVHSLGPVYSRYSIVKNYVIPTTVVDDFFDDPYLVTEFASKQSYAKDVHNQWPGERTESLHKLNPDFFANTINKFLRIFLRVQ